MPGRSAVGVTTYGSALQFNGSTQSAGRAIFSAVTNNLTMCCWVKLLSYVLPGGAQRNILIGNGQDDADGYHLYIRGDTHELQLDVSFVANLNSAITLSIGTWYHVAVTRTAGTWQLWINAATAGGTIANNPNSPGNFFTVGSGRPSSGVADKFSNAIIDDVRFYERALSASDLTAIYNHASNPNLSDAATTNLKGSYQFEEGTGTTVGDSSGNGLNLTTTNSPSWVTGIVQISNIPARTVLPVPILLSDTFGGVVTTNFNIAGTSTWNTTSGTLNVASLGGPNWGDTLVLTKTTSYTDFDIYARVQKPAANTMIIFRSGTTFGTGYGIQLRDVGNFRLENWGSAAIQTVFSGNWVTNNWYQVRIRTQGKHIQAKVWADGTTEPDAWNIDLYDSTFASGGIGFACENTQGSFDDLYVYTLNRRVLG